MKELDNEWTPAHYAHKTDFPNPGDQWTKYSSDDNDEEWIWSVPNQTYEKFTGQNPPPR